MTQLAVKQDEGRRHDGWQERLPIALRRVIKGLQGEDVLLLASSLSFYALVSIIPMVILVLWLAGLIVGHNQVRDFADSLARYAPKKLGLDGLARQVANVGGSIGLVAVIGMLWPSTSYGSGLVRAFDRLDHRDRGQLKGLKGRLLALSFVIILPLLVAGALLVSFAMSSLIGDGAVSGLGYVGALVITFVSACATIGLIYRLFPTDRLSWRAIWAGTFGTAVAVAILSIAYTVFIDTAADFQTRYASSAVAAVVLLALWLYLVNALILGGYQVAVEVQRDVG